MDLDIRQYKNRYGQNGLEGDVSKSKRSTSRPGGKALNQSSSGHPRGTERVSSRPMSRRQKVSRDDKDYSGTPNQRAGLNSSSKSSFAIHCSALGYMSDRIESKWK